MRQEMRLQTEIEKLRMFRVVIMLLRLNARIGEVFHRDCHAQLFRGGLHHLRDFQYRKLFRKLVVYAAFTPSRGVQTGDFDAAYGITDVQESARLAALPINSERMSDNRLNAEAVQHR